MTHLLRLRIRITEPWDFGRITGLEELTGTTADHLDPEAEEWELELDESYEMNDVVHARVLIGPRYVGEALARVFDAIAGLPVRVAHRQGGEWRYAMAGMLALRREEEEEN